MRTKGALNYATREFKAYWHQFFSTSEFRDKVKKDILNGSAPPQLVVYLMAMVYGKPRETFDVNVTASHEEDLSTLSLEELLRRNEEVTKALQEAKELEAAIPAEYRIEKTADVA